MRSSAQISGISIALLTIATVPHSLTAGAASTCKPLKITFNHHQLQQHSQPRCDTPAYFFSLEQTTFKNL